MSDNENNLFDLEGDALDEALLAAIDETDEEERLAREKKAQENLERAEQARITAIEKEQARAKIDELRKNLPKEEDISSPLKSSSASPTGMRLL